MFYAITRFRKSSSRLNNIKRRYRFDIKFPAEKFQPSPNFDQYSETIPEHTAIRGTLRKPGRYANNLGNSIQSQIFTLASSRYRASFATNTIVPNKVCVYMCVWKARLTSYETGSVQSFATNTIVPNKVCVYMCVWKARLTSYETGSVQVSCGAQVEVYVQQAPRRCGNLRRVDVSNFRQVSCGAQVHDVKGVKETFCDTAPV
ncbi:hypothetical protein QE152_g13266 [Popillia japonica]|uniref:Uncharacterized protein n=1 Tax=Popillia japonica TaxID=7064 RepID=A0AAW1LDZ5_POPJA